MTSRKQFYDALYAAVRSRRFEEQKGPAGRSRAVHCSAMADDDRTIVPAGTYWIDTSVTLNRHGPWKGYWSGSWQSSDRSCGLCVCLPSREAAEDWVETARIAFNLRYHREHDDGE